MNAVFWSFFGIRKESDDEKKDAAQSNPAHAIIAGLIGGLIYIVTLVLVLIVESVVAE